MSLSDEIKSTILSGIVAANQRKVGVEIEGLYYTSGFNRLPVNKTTQYSAVDLLEEISQSAKKDFPFSYSLEPGGQLEWASGPSISLWDIQKQFEDHKKIEDSICKKHFIDRLYLSLEPFCLPSDIDLININKYQLMHNLFSKTGDLGPWMMRNTTSMQLNIDFISEQDANEMAFLADIIQPLYSILFSNSPFMSGRPVNKRNMRWKIWADTDPRRCGSLFEHGINSAEKTTDQYVAWLPNIKTIFKYNKSGATEPFNGTLGKMILSEPSKMQPHINSALHQSFTHVRFKTVLEVRAADRPPKDSELAPAAFLAGLLTAPKTRAEGIDVISRWSHDDRKQLVETAHNLSLNQLGPENKSIGDWLEFWAELSLKGLNEREKIFEIKNERPLVQSFLEDVLARGPKTTQTQNMFQKTNASLHDFLRQACLDSAS